MLLRELSWILGVVFIVLVIVALVGNFVSFR